MTLPSDSVTLHSQRQCDVLCNRKSEIRQEPQTKALLYLMQICVYIYESCCADIGYQEGKNAISHSPCSVSAVTNEQQFTLWENLNQHHLHFGLYFDCLGGTEWQKLQNWS